MRDKIEEMINNIDNSDFIGVNNLQLPSGWTVKDDGFSAFVMTANGKGMRKAGIEDGDLVYCKRIDTPRHNSLIAAMLEDGSVVLRRYLEIDGNKILRRENGRTPDLVNPKFEAFGEVFAIHRIIGQGA